MIQAPIPHLDTLVEDVDVALYRLTSAITDHLDAGGSWESAFEQFSKGRRYVNRLGIHSAATFRRRFGEWVESERRCRRGEV